jgi:hypothetical protein
LAEVNHHKETAMDTNRRKVLLFACAVLIAAFIGRATTLKSAAGAAAEDNQFGAAQVQFQVVQMAGNIHSDIYFFDRATGIVSFSEVDGNKISGPNYIGVYKTPPIPSGNPK